jgi:hypothetical protein
MRGGGWAVPFCVGHVEQTGHEISECLHARRWGGPFRSVSVTLNRVRLHARRSVGFRFCFGYDKKPARTSRRFARASP